MLGRTCEFGKDNKFVEDDSGEVLSGPSDANTSIDR